MSSSASVIRVETNSLVNDPNFARRLEHEEVTSLEMNKWSGSPLKTRLKADQERGIAWALAREESSVRAVKGGLILDELGTGKTLQMLAVISASIIEARKAIRGRQASSEAMQQRLEKPHTLVVCPTNVVYQWKQQAQDHFRRRRALSVGVYHGSTKEKREVLENIEEYDIIVTTYGLLANHLQPCHELSSQHPLDERGCCITCSSVPSPFSRWYYRVVLDEAHNIRNFQSKTFWAASKISADVRWCMTGTPIWNNIYDLYSLFAFLSAYPYAEFQTFQMDVAWRLRARPGDVFRELGEFMLPFSIRRKKREGMLPPKTEYEVRIDMTETERLFYDSLLNYNRDRVRRLFQAQRFLKRTPFVTYGRRLQMRHQSGILSMFLRMRQACDHPQLVINRLNKCLQFDPSDLDALLEPEVILRAAAERLQQALAEENICPICIEPTDSVSVPCGHYICAECYESLLEDSRARSYGCRCPMCRSAITGCENTREAVKHALHPSSTESDENYEMEVEREHWGDSSKITKLLEMLKERGNKSLVFSQWTKMLDLIEEALHREGIETLRLDGSVSAKLRRDRQELFTRSPHILVMLCSLTSSSEGMNLQAARDVYMFDPWWNEARTQQAANRAHRLGQRSDVDIFHFLIRNSIEERVKALQDMRGELSRTTLTGTNTQTDLMTWAGSVKFAFDIS